MCYSYSLCFAGTMYNISCIGEIAPCTESSKLLGCVVANPYHSSFGELGQGICITSGRFLIKLGNGYLACLRMGREGGCILSSKDVHLHLAHIMTCDSLVNPLGPRLPTLLTYRVTPECPLAAGYQTIHTSISVYRNGILARLVSTVVYYFRRCPLFKVRWSLRDAEFSKL